MLNCGEPLNGDVNDELDLEILPHKRPKEDNFLSGLLVNISKNSHYRAETSEQERINRFNQIKSVIELAERLRSKHPQAEIEIEGRIGSSSGTFFNSGISEMEFVKIQDIFNHPSLSRLVQLYNPTSEIDYIFPDPYDKKVLSRITCDMEEMPIRSGTKIKYHNSVFQPLRKDINYAFRIAIAIEDFEKASSCEVPSNWSIRREKQRFSWTFQNHPHWRIDLTQVHSQWQPDNYLNQDSSKNRRNPLSFELEIEMLKSNFSTTTESLLYEQTKGLQNMLTFVFQSLIKVASNDYLFQDNLESLVRLLDDRLPIACLSKSMTSNLGPSFSPQNTGKSNQDPLLFIGSINNESKETPNVQSFFPFPEIKTELISDSKTLRLTVNQILQIDDQSKDFPGSMPVSFSRRHFSTVLNNEYYVSEKTDGVRYMLLVINSGVYLVDRSFRFFRVKVFSEGPHALYPLFSQSGPTLLDGEMVRHFHTTTPYYLIFDCIMFDGYFYGLNNLNDRLQQIGNAIRIYRENFDFQTYTQLHPFFLIGKTLLPRTHFSNIERLIQEILGEIVYNEEKVGTSKTAKRCHLTDGIIFTPANEPYRIKSCPLLFKWKFLDQISIDFKIARHHTDKNIAMYLQGDGREVRCKSIALEEQDYNNLMNDWKREGCCEPIIAEMIFSPSLGKWKYKMLRTDKLKANHVMSAFETMETIAESITFEELKKLLRRDRK